MKRSLTRKNVKPFILGIITGSRADFGIWTSIIEAILKENDIKLQLFATEWQSRTEIEAWKNSQQNLTIEIKNIQIPAPGESLMDMGHSLLETSRIFMQLFKTNKPHALLVLGDRYETFAATQAAFYHRIPIIHFHGGETTEGAVDDAFRTSISAFSDLHFVAAQSFKEKLEGMGIKSNKIINSGSPSLEKIKQYSRYNRELCTPAYGNQTLPEGNHILIVFHPVTRYQDMGLQELNELIAAVKDLDQALVISLGYSDPACLIFNKKLKELVRYRKRKDDLILLEGDNIGFIYFFRTARMILGNSSAALIEAPFLKVPAINVGIRQKGRLSAKYTIHVPAEKEAIQKAIQKANTEKWRIKVQADISPYGNGTATKKIIPALRKYLNDKYPNL